MNIFRVLAILFLKILYKSCEKAAWCNCLVFFLFLIYTITIICLCSHVHLSIYLSVCICAHLNYAAYKETKIDCYADNLVVVRTITDKVRGAGGAWNRYGRSVPVVDIRKNERS